jgi:ATP-dependent DNA helicase DinG
MQLLNIGLKPSDLGLVVQNDSWRIDQLEKIQQILNSPKKIIVFQAPTGSGKSIVAEAVLAILGRRAIILTKTKDLQFQYEQTGVVGLYGRDNYVCNRFPLVSAANGVCHLGQSCRLRFAGCDYYDQKRTAIAARAAVLNYSYFFLEANGPGDFSARDWIVADEAHSLPEELSRAYTIRISHIDCRKLGVAVPKAKDRVDINQWREWAKNEQGKIFGLSKHATGDRALLLQRIRSACNFFCVLPTGNVANWIAETDNYKTIIRPVWVNNLARNYLWRHAQKFLLMSATINGKQVLNELGVNEADAEIIEVASNFPVANHPIRYRPTVRLSHKSTEEEISGLVDTIDAIIDKYPGRGIIHTGNYTFAGRIATMSKHKRELIVHKPDTRAAAIEQFKRTNLGNGKPNQRESSSKERILVSPSLTEGLDFPYEQCQFQIIARLPFPNRVDPVWAARFAQDKKKGEDAYTNSVISSIVQATGRGMRAVDDSCITFILDSNFTWLYNRNLSSFPRHFRDSLRTVVNV